MPDFRALIVKSGTTQAITTTDTLIVGDKLDSAALSTLTIGGTNATGITIGSGAITTSFPGPVELTGDVTTVGGTQFTTDAQFDGDVTFGNANTDTVTFVSKVDSDITFAGGSPTYKITNLANGTNPNDAVNFSQLSAIVSGVSSVGATAPLLSSGGSTPNISISTVGASAGNVLTYNGSAWAAAAPAASSLTVGSTAIASGAINRVLFEGAGNVLQESANLTFDGTTLGVNGVVSVGEGSAPAATAAFGKLWANSAADARPYWLDDTGQSFNLTLDRFNTLTPAASVAIDTSPALPVFNSIALNQNTTFTTSNLGNGRSASVRVVCDGTTRTLSWPAGWTWLGSGPPSSLAANDVGYLSITAYGATNADVVAAWSYENQPAAVTGSGVDNQIAVWSGTTTQDGSSALTFNGTTLGVTGAITQSGGAVGLTANAASSFTTSAGALTLTSAAAATWSSTAGNLAITGGANLELGAAASSEVVVNQAGANVDFRVESTTNTHALFVDANAGANLGVGVGTSNVGTHLFNVGAGALSNFAVASGGFIHTYGGANPADGQVLIGHAVNGRFQAATLTPGSGVSITNGAGSITIAATGSGGTVTSVDVSGGTTGLTTSGGPIIGSGTITLGGTLNVANGGTGSTSLALNNVLLGNGTAAVQAVAPGTAGNVLQSDGTTWQSTALPAATDYSVVTLTTAQAANTAVTVAGAAAIATAASTSRVAGIVTATNTVKVLGICTCAVETTSPAISAGDPVYLSALEAGTVTGTAPSTATQVVAELGIATAASGGGTVAVLWQPKSIVVL